MIISLDPQSYIEATQNPYWDADMDEGCQPLMKNKTWELVPLPLGRNVIQCKWMYKKKMAVDGHVRKYKSRLLAKVFSQVRDMDYNETFALVAKMESIKLIVTIVATQQWEVHLIDVKSAFLHGDLEKEI